MRYILTFILVCAFTASEAREKVRVLVLDSGFNVTPDLVPLCADGHADFTGSGLRDTVPHGTNVASLIAQQVDDTTAYCITIIKVLKDKDGNAQRPYLDGLKHGLRYKGAVWNLSLSGRSYIGTEARLLKQALDEGATIFAAAGNGEARFIGRNMRYVAVNLDRKCDVFPACVDPRVRVVSAFDLPRSNFGAIVDVWETGAQQTGGGVTLSGTSQATAISTGKHVQRLLKQGGQ